MELIFGERIETWGRGLRTSGNHPLLRVRVPAVNQMSGARPPGFVLVRRSAGFCECGEHISAAPRRAGSNRRRG